MTLTIIVAVIAVVGWVAFFLTRSELKFEAKNATNMAKLAGDRAATIQNLEAQVRHARTERDGLKRKWNAVNDGERMYVERNIEAQDMAKAARKREEDQRAADARRAAKEAARAKAASRAKVTARHSSTSTSTYFDSTPSTYSDTSSSCDSGSSGGGCD